MISAEQTRLVVDGSVAVELPDATLHADELGVELQLVTRQHGLAEAQLVRADEVVEGAIGRLHVEHLETEDAGGLGHRLDDQHAGHDRMLREVAIEERLVDADILVGANALCLDVQLNHPIHQQAKGSDEAGIRESR